jgi:hypothetical protein
MNEQIEKLAEQATVRGEEDLPGNDGHPTPTVYFDKEKFAELIVRECCNKIERKYKYALGEKTQWAMSQDVQDLLKEHFGVEQ